jgi:predicted phosphodiesterase
MKRLKVERPFAVFSDAHGNLPALEAVLEDIKGRGITAMICLGDLVGYGPFPNE